ncbi:MAG: ATP-binding cassette domain-containing protein [Acidobacteria bacterium]|nr:ATP-binding cassette domain-containing protein [Acidobacteriota bacterium]
MLSIKDLTKTYSSGVQALKGVSLDLSPGVFGLLGPNGSGKTTLMKIVATLLEPDSGTIEINGADLLTRKMQTRRMLGYLPQDFGLYPTLTAWQMLDYLAKLKGITDKKERHTLVDALLDRVNLSSARQQRLGGFSGGMRQRFGIAQALIGAPKREDSRFTHAAASGRPTQRIRLGGDRAARESRHSKVSVERALVADV